MKYTDEDSLAGELIEKIQLLRTVHFETNNFYNEFMHAKSISDSLPIRNKIPDATRKLLLKLL